jgi:hypothetical protein
MARTSPARLVALVVLLLALPIARAATITVNSTGDTITPNDGAVTFREALTAINAGNDLGDPNITSQNPGTFGTNDTINFNISGSGVHTITPATNLPAITKPVTINGYSQPGASANTNPFPGPLNGTLLIQLSATQLPISASNVTIRGLVLSNAVDEIEINPGQSNVTIAGNYIGTDPAGTTATGSATGGFGIRIDGGSGHVIGGAAPADRNLISGNRQGGIFANGTSTDNLTIQGNFIGSDATGTTALLTGIVGGQGITVHSPATNATIVNNLVSGNAGGGIEDDSSNGVVQGNLIGVQRDGSSALPNANFGGLILNYAGQGAGGIAVGGTGAGQANVIAKNAGFGIVVYSDNNPILENSIYGNTQKEISINAITGNVLANDNCDADTGPGNTFQNYPVLTSAVIANGNVTFSGTLNSLPNDDFRIEFFSNTSCNPSGNGGGQTFLGSINVTTNGTCTTSFGPVSFAVPNGQSVFTATATNSANNTSEFSACKSQAVAGTTTTALTSSKNPSTFGQSVTFTATVTGSNPTGTVQFMDGATALGAPAALTGGVATLLTSSLSVATHPITAVYSGDANNQPSTSNVVDQQVVAAASATTTAVTSSLNPSTFGQTVTFIATVSGGSNPTGTIQFMDGATALGAPVALSGGAAQLPTAALSVGQHSISAVYSGDANNLGSTSPVLTQNVLPLVTPPPATTIDIPTLSAWALGLLSTLVAALGFLGVRRRSRGGG